MSHGNEICGYSAGALDKYCRDVNSTCGDAPSLQSSSLDGGKYWKLPSPPRSWLSDKDPSSNGAFPSNFERVTDNSRKPMRKRKHEGARMDTNDPMIEDEDERIAAKRARVLVDSERIWPRPAHSMLMPSVVQMHIGNLNKSITSTDILQLTNDYSIGSVLVTFPSKRRKREFAFITILQSDIGNALKMNGAELMGRKITVAEAYSQEIPSLQCRLPIQRLRHMCFCVFSKSDDGRCAVDATPPSDQPDPICPFGKHRMDVFIRHFVPPKEPSQEELIREERKKMNAEARSIAQQRKYSNDPRVIEIQNQKCHKLLQKKPLDEYLEEPLPSNTPHTQEREKRREAMRQRQEELANEIRLREEANFVALASTHEMEYWCEIGSKSDATKRAKKVVNKMKRYYKDKEKCPSEVDDQGQAAWQLLTEEFPSIVLAIRDLLINDENYCESEDGRLYFKTRPMAGEDSSLPGVYLLICFLSNWIKIGMSNNKNTGSAGRVENQIPIEATPEECSAICMTREEIVAMMKRSPVLNSFIESLLKMLPAFQYHEDHKDQAYAEVANQVMESAIMAMMLRSNDREVNIGLGLERLFNVGSRFIDEYCRFPSPVVGDNRWIIDFMRRTKLCSSITTWITASSALYDLIEDCDDDATLEGLQHILKKRPKGKFLTNAMHELSFDASTNTNPRWGGYCDAITSCPVIDYVSKLIDDIKKVLDDDAKDETGERRPENRKSITDIIKQFDNATKFRYDFHEPDETDLARKSIDLMRSHIKDAKKLLEAEAEDEPSDSTVAIYIEECAIDAIKKQPSGPSDLSKLMAPKSHEKKAIGHYDQFASYRVVPDTDDRICFVIIKSYCPVLGQSSEANENGRQYSTRGRIRGILDYQSLVGINKRAEIVAPEYAETLQRICKSALIMWEGMAGDFGSSVAIERSNLNAGINLVLPIGFNRGRHVQRGTVALGNLLSPHGMNEYLTALMLLRLGMKSFAQAIHLISGKHINQDNLRESMDEFRKVQRRMDLGRMPTERRNNISKALKGKKKQSDEHRNKISKAMKGVKNSTEQNIAISLGKKISIVEKAIEEGMRYSIYEYECKKCKKDMKSEYKSIYHVFGVELFNQNRMTGTCPCCGKRDTHLRTARKHFNYLREVSLGHLKKCHTKACSSC